MNPEIVSHCSTLLVEFTSHPKLTKQIYFFLKIWSIAPNQSKKRSVHVLGHWLAVYGVWTVHTNTRSAKICSQINKKAIAETRDCVKWQMWKGLEVVFFIFLCRKHGTNGFSCRVQAMQKAPACEPQRPRSRVVSVQKGTCCVISGDNQTLLITWVIAASQPNSQVSVSRRRFVCQRQPPDYC